MVGKVRDQRCVCVVAWGGGVGKAEDILRSI